MKKVISVVIATVIAISSFVMAFAAPLQETREIKELNSFINGITELAREYDKGKDFVVPDNDKTAQIQTFSAGNTTDDTDNNTEQEYTLQDFQTARLIVRADGSFDDFGALEDISGFEDFHILQYKSSEEAMAAYDLLQSEKNITEVTLDEVCTYCGYEGTPENPDIISKDEFLNDWSRDRTQSKRLQDYLAESDIAKNEIIVGVVDSGIDYNHEIFEGRVERTYFNVTASGNPDDEMDDEIAYHGTTVSSVIVNNSPENIKVAVYKVGDNDSMTVTAIAAGLLAAIEKCNIINTSLSSLSDVSLITKIVLEAYSKNIPIFAAVGNRGMMQTDPVPANVPECIAVSATDFNNTTSSINTQTINSDVSAPGEDVAVAIPGNRYTRFSGTSYSTPYTAALGAILKSVNPEITVDEIDARLKETSFDAKRYNKSPSSQGSFMDNYCSQWDGVGMIQFCDALGLEKLTAPVLNLEDKVYVGEQTCTITCEDKNATVLYTTDGTYPDFENANVYTQPFQITKRTRIRAVAYYPDGGYYSDEAEATPRIQYTDSDDNFVIDNNGVITKYKGSISDLYVPETINGITVTGFVKGAFVNVVSLTLPETVTEIPVSAFAKNSIIEFVSGKGVVTVKSDAFLESGIMYVEFPAAEHIQASAFYVTSKLCSGDFSNVEIIESDAFSYSNIISFYGPEIQTIEDGAFGSCPRLENVYFPQCTMIDIIWGVANGVFDSCPRLVRAEMLLITNLTYNAFNGTSISKADFPYVKTIEEKAFYECFELEYINMPALLTVPKQAFGSKSSSLFNKYTYIRSFYLDSVTQIEQDAFGKHPTARIEFSHLETAQSLPQTEGCIIAMPSTFKKCNEKTVGRNYKVYGTKGTYAEEWANKNGHKFTEISQKTAVLTQLPKQYTVADDVLTADVIGFNRTYQWYANTEDSNETGTPIEGATDREFNPEDYPAAKYYYCVVTSTDVGYDPIEIRTGVTENTTLEPADYSKVEKAKSEIPEDLSVYTDESVKALQDILDNIDYSLDETEQSKVDDYAEAIEEAVNSLEYKPADYTAYNAAVEKANALDRSLYQDLTDLDNALSVDVKDKNITEQAVIDKQAKAIEEESTPLNTNRRTTQSITKQSKRQMPLTAVCIKT